MSAKGAKQTLTSNAPPTGPFDLFGCARGCNDNGLLVDAKLLVRHSVDCRLDDPRFKLEPYIRLACRIDANGHAKVFDNAAQAERASNDPEV